MSSGGGGDRDDDRDILDMRGSGGDGGGDGASSLESKDSERNGASLAPASPPGTPPPGTACPAEDCPPPPNVVDPVVDDPSEPEPLWRRSHENILKRIGEQCFMYEILHRKSSEYYLRQSRRFNVPIIVLSTISGTLSFSTESTPESIRRYLPFGVGAINIFVGILSTVSSLLMLSENYKLHFTAACVFGKLGRTVACRLALPPVDRGVCGTECIRGVRAEFESALEQAPPLAKRHVSTVRNRKYTLHPPTLIRPVEIEIHGTAASIPTQPSPTRSASAEGGRGDTRWD